MVYANPFFYALNRAIGKTDNFNFEHRKYTKVVKFRFNRTLLISGCSNFDPKHATKLVLRVLSYYQILGVSEDASLDDIKSAFKKQALKFHPDRNQEDPSAEELFKELNNAYQTLSNPYSRHKYDMTLKFGSFDIPQQPTTPPPPFRKRPKQPFYKKVSLTSKENLRATMYAFLFAFFVGLFIKIGVWLTDYYKAIKKEKILTERREEFGKVQSAFNKGELKESLFMLDDMGMFFESELDMREYKDMLLNHVLTRANNSMEEERYKAALRYYEILDRFSIKNSLNILLNKAKAHKGLGNYQEAIAAYQLLFFNGYRSLSFYVEMGELYEDGFQDYESALNYYQKATNMAASSYESTYGKAYPVMINAEMIPKRHFDIFMKLANAHFMVGDYESAIRSVVWTKEIWPDSSKNYTLSGKSLLAQGKQTLACNDFLLAKDLNPTVKIPSICD